MKKGRKHALVQIQVRQNGAADNGRHFVRFYVDFIYSVKHRVGHLRVKER